MTIAMKKRALLGAIDSLVLLLLAAAAWVAVGGIASVSAFVLVPPPSHTSAPRISTHSPACVQRRLLVPRIPPSPSASTPLEARRGGKGSGNDRDRRDNGGAFFAQNLQKRTDPGIFLTQRAIQSFIFLLQSFRDPHTVRWIEVRILR